MRQPIICGNWKMNCTIDEATALIGRMISQFDAGGAHKGVEVAVCPPFTALHAASMMLTEQRSQHEVQLGAQNVWHEMKGAFTGEVSPVMLAELGVSYVIVGHSERRTIFGETDETISRKVRAVLSAGMRPILCIGETLAERESNATERVLTTQLAGSLNGITSEDMDRVTIAYEPVWAIGTGKTATPEQAQSTHAFIRQTVAGMFTKEVAEAIRIQYGGSMNAANAAELLAQPDIDGGLIGGAALQAESFLKIVEAGAQQ